MLNPGRGPRDAARGRASAYTFLAVALGYFVVLAVLLELVGASASVLVLVPAALAGGLFGVAAGVLAAVATFALTSGVVAISGHRPGDVVVQLGSGVGAVVVVAVAAGFGRIAELGRSAARMAAELRVREERLRRIIADAPVAIYATDRDGTCTFAGGTAIAALGLSERNLVGRNVRDAPLEQPITEAISTAIAGREVKRRVDYGGRTFEAHFAPLSDGGGGMIAVAVDVTGSEQMLDALRGAEERLRAVTSNLPLIVLTLEPDGTIARSEGSGLNALGLRQGEFDGRSVLELGFPPFAAAVRRALAGQQATADAEIAGQRVELRFTNAGAESAGPIFAVTSLRSDDAAMNPAARRRVALGEYLIANGAILGAELEDALAEQATRGARGEDVLLGALLVDQGRITVDQLQTALEQRARSTRVDELGSA